jgi:hypothetical protein
MLENLNRALSTTAFYPLKAVSMGPLLVSLRCLGLEKGTSQLREALPYAQLQFAQS